MQAINWISIYKKYKGLWVALKSPNELIVVASAKTLKETMQKAQNKGVKDPFVAQIPTEVTPLVGCSQ